jgi:mRNA-degrading endonuclease RelE of RelBE toxin-antitoxin system
MGNSYDFTEIDPHGVSGREILSDYRNVMDKIDKFLRKLNAQESHIVAKAIADILSRSFDGYDRKKLNGYRDIYRIRIGTIRIIYRELADDIEMLEVSRRSEKTYSSTSTTLSIHILSHLASN